MVNVSEKKVLDVFKRPIRDLRVSVTDQCFLRCFYCMPKEIFGNSHCFADESSLLSYDDIERLIRIFADLGVEKIRLTGGEPLMRPNLTELIERINAISGIKDVALTTNGLLLKKYLNDLKTAGLKRLNISLDSIDDKTLKAVTGKNIQAKQVLDAIDSAVAAGFPVKVNMVVTRGINDHQLIPMARTMKERGVALRFIEYMDVGNTNEWSVDDVVSGESIRKTLKDEFEINELPPNYPGEVARRYAYADCGTELGFIESISKPFCGACNRARISAVGKLFTCLFSTKGFDLKPWLEDTSISDYDLNKKLSLLWQGRRDKYSEDRFSKEKPSGEDKKVEMWQIGG